MVTNRELNNRIADKIAKKKENLQNQICECGHKRYLHQNEMVFCKGTTGIEGMPCKCKQFKQKK